MAIVIDHYLSLAVVFVVHLVFKIPQNRGEGLTIHHSNNTW